MKKITSTFLFCFFLLSFAVEGQCAIKSHHLSFEFDLANHSFQAIDTLVIAPSGHHFSFLLNKDFKIEKITILGKMAKFKANDDFNWNFFGKDFEKGDSLFFQRAKMYSIKLSKKLSKLKTVEIAVHYSGIVYDTISVAAFSRSRIADQTIGIIGEEGIYLSPQALYYPYDGEGMNLFKVTTFTPGEYYTVTDGKLVANIQGDNARIMVWDSEFPTDGIYLSGAKLNLHKDIAGEVEVLGFFFPEDEEICLQYIDATKRYLNMYDGLIGEYPYPKFAIVENFFPTGYGMPSWTLLGREVVKLPWIVNISLGHEVCHNWWGNGVFVDYKQGNWCEGLTTYCADYLYKERRTENEAVEYRRGINQEYTAYVNEGNDYPLSAFREREGAYTRAIGYGKSAMVFHMLKLEVGETNFWGALQEFYHEYLFKKADWKDIQSAFEKRSGQDLNWFFQQWIYQKGAPSLKLEKAEIGKSQFGSALELSVLQATPGLKIKVPITIRYAEGDTTQWFYLHPGNNEISIDCPQLPLFVEVDPKFDVFRILDRNEYPASLAEVFGAKKQIIVLPSSTTEDKFVAYKALAEVLNSEGEALMKIDTTLTLQELSNNSLFLMGDISENKSFQSFQSEEFKWSDWVVFLNDKGNFSLMGQSFNGEKCAMMITVRNPLNTQESIAVFCATTPQEVGLSGNKLIHYGKYSYLAFEEGKNKMKGNWEIKRSPLSQRF